MEKRYAITQLVDLTELKNKIETKTNNCAIILPSDLVIFAALFYEYTRIH
jgi:hypothetical protein